jgi:hypothetical protein
MTLNLNQKTLKKLDLKNLNSEQIKELITPFDLFGVTDEEYNIGLAAVVRKITAGVDADEITPVRYGLMLRRAILDYDIELLETQKGKLIYFYRSPLTNKSNELAVEVLLSVIDEKLAKRYIKRAALNEHNA